MRKDGETLKSLNLGTEILLLDGAFVSFYFNLWTIRFKNSFTYIVYFFLYVVPFLIPIALQELRKRKVDLKWNNPFDLLIVIMATIFCAQIFQTVFLNRNIFIWALFFLCYFFILKQKGNTLESIFLVTLLILAVTETWEVFHVAFYRIQNNVPLQTIYKPLQRLLIPNIILAFYITPKKFLTQLTRKTTLMAIASSILSASIEFHYLSNLPWIPLQIFIVAYLPRFAWGYIYLGYAQELRETKKCIWKR